MGRKKVYLTKLSKTKAQRKWQMEYYHRNRESVKVKNLARYHENIQNLQNNKQKKQ